MHTVKLQIRSNGENKIFEIIGINEDEAKEIANTILDVWQTATPAEKQSIAALVALKKPLSLLKIPGADFAEFFADKSNALFARKDRNNNTYYVIMAHESVVVSSNEAVIEAAAVKQLQKQNVAAAQEWKVAEASVELLDEQPSEDEKLTMLIYTAIQSALDKLDISGLEERMEKLEQLIKEK